MDKSAQKNSSTVLLDVILGTNSSCLSETLCLALGTIWKAQFTVTTEMVRSSCNQGRRAAAQGSRQTGSRGSAGLGGPRNEREPVGWDATALLGPPSTAEQREQRWGTFLGDRRSPPTRV